MVYPLVSLFIFLTLSIAAFGAGRPLLRWIGVADDDRLTTAAFSIGLGLATAGLVLLALGLAGVLYPPLIGLLTMIACCWGLVEIGMLSMRPHDHAADEFSRPADPWEASFDPPWASPPRWLVVAILAATSIVCAASLLGALALPRPM